MKLVEKFLLASVAIPTILLVWAAVFLAIDIIADTTFGFDLSGWLTNKF